MLKGVNHDDKVWLVLYFNNRSLKMIIPLVIILRLLMSLQFFKIVDFISWKCTVQKWKITKFPSKQWTFFFLFNQYQFSVKSMNEMFSIDYFNEFSVKSMDFFTKVISRIFASNHHAFDYLFLLQWITLDLFFLFWRPFSSFIHSALR